ncbi:MAG: ECF-type sigma factor [Gemmatimonadota bacterium]
MIAADIALRARTTALIEAVTAGGDSLEDLLPIVYEELRQIARRHLRGEQVGHTLRTTALVHEAYFKLVDHTRVTSKGRAYFFAAAAQAMRQVLVDHARRRSAHKRGGGAPPFSIDDAEIAVDEYADELIDLDRALADLQELSPRQMRVVECRFFGGMSVEETAEALDVSPRTVTGDWSVARAWLYNALQSDAS